MKEILLLVLLAGFASATNASYLIWQVNESDYTGTGLATSMGWNAAIVYQVEGGASQVSTWNATDANNKMDPMSGASVVGVNYLVDGARIDTSETLGSVIPAMPEGQSIAAQIVNSGDSSGYAYYIELVNYDFSGDGKVNRVIARSNAYTYANLTGNITDSLSITTVSGISAWHGSNFTAVPEPTSGLMVLLGAAALGLRRRKRSLA